MYVSLAAILQHARDVVMPPAEALQPFLVETRLLQAQLSKRIFLASTSCSESTLLVMEDIAGAFLVNRIMRTCGSKAFGMFLHDISH